uniref:high affinity immunoglobulin gamma Fc receptor I-like isoform X1 n=1 Tax=Centroberyx gerrardi TaxID=166262 RepID=UPI003AAC74F2
MLKMDTLLSLLVVSTLPQIVVLDVLSVAPYQAVVEQVAGDSRIFSGESIRLRCSIPEDMKSTWRHLWFRGAEQLQESEEFSLWDANVKQSGKYSCQGMRETIVGPIHTLQSLPVEIDVDGGWAILQVPPHPTLVGETLKVTCRVRGNPKLEEVILYRDDVEVKRQTGSNPHVHLSNVDLRDRGLYTCRATWDIRRHSHSVVSVPTQVYISEILTQPFLEVVPRDPLIPANMMRLICHLQYNAHAPAPPIHFYFYKNGNKLTTASSENNVAVERTPGQYSCKARVPELDLMRWSETKNFGQVTVGTEQRILPPRVPKPFAPPTAAPALTLPTAVKPRAAWPVPRQPTAAPTYPWLKEEIPQPTDAPLKPIQPAAKPQLPGVMPKTSNQTVPPDLVDMSGDYPAAPEQLE